MSRLPGTPTPLLRRGPVYRLARTIVSPILPGRGPSVRLRRPARGERVLNIGSGPLRYDAAVINVDRDAHDGVRVRADARALPFRDGSIDGVICEVTLEHVRDPAAAMAEMRRVLRPGGRGYISVPFLQPMHSAPEDFTRWTVHGLRRLVGDADLAVVEAGVAGGPTATLTWMLAEYAALLLSFGSDAVQSSIAVALRVLLAPLKAVDLLLVHLRPAPILASLIYVVVERPAPVEKPPPPG